MSRQNRKQHCEAANKLSGRPMNLKPRQTPVTQPFKKIRAFKKTFSDYA